MGFKDKLNRRSKKKNNNVEMGVFHRLIARKKKLVFP